ncbi:UNVERIFIED_CONTAM: hypothetical protein Slati_3686800 [Sesamum latifolium]|uniref:Retrotransposon gag domain-containing protein n=1 Tax=Sesamum latifolium TaxID=2727402 RepID=A0AAW2U5F3_9LAMI
MGQRSRGAVEEMSVLTNVIDLRINGMQADLNMLKRAVGREEDRAPLSKATKVPDAEKVSITSMYLTEDTKLWWRSRLLDDASANRERIETWDVLKKELNDQFLPCNTSWVSRESLRNLRHTGTVRAFVKEFNSILLDMRDMSEEDKRFNFMADFKVVNDLEQRQDDPGKGKAKFGKKYKRKEKAKEVVTETSEPRAVEKPRGGCFICRNLEHRARDCPKRGKLNAIVAEQTDGDSETKQTRVGALQLSVLQAESRACVESRYKGLMMVAGQINDHVKAVNSKAVPVSGVANTELRVSSWSGQYDFMTVRLDDFDVILGIDFFIVANVMILPRLGGIFISGENKPLFVRGEYEGDTTARKKPKVVEAGPSNASSSKEGAHSPHIAGFCCIRKMQEEMDRRWTKAQQACGAEPESFTYADVLKRERECEGKHFNNVHGGKRALVQSTSGMRTGLGSECRQGSARGICGSRQTVQGLLACVGAIARGRWTAHGTMLLKLRNGRVIVRAGCTAGGRVGLVSVVSAGRCRACGLESRQRAGWCPAWPKNVRSRQADARSTRPRCANGCGLVRTTLGQGVRMDAVLCAQHSAKLTDACAQHSASVRRQGGWLPIACARVRMGSAAWPTKCARVQTGSAAWPTECAQMRDGLGRLADDWHEMRPMDGNPRQVGKGCADGPDDRQTAVGSGQGLVVGCEGKGMEHVRDM